MNVINDQRRPEEGIQETWLVRREEVAYEPNLNSHSSQSSRGNISSSKHKQVGSARNDDQGENAAVGITDGGEDPGKIAKRLKLIEEAFLSYVHSHQERLEARLDESRTLEQNFIEAVRELERDINSLIVEQEELDEYPNLETPSDQTQTEENL